MAKGRARKEREGKPAGGMAVWIGGEGGEVFTRIDTLGVIVGQRERGRGREGKKGE